MLYAVATFTLLFNIKFLWNVKLVRHGSAVLFSLLHTLGQKILYLSVERAEIVLCPSGYCGIELRRKTQGNLLFGSIVIHQ